MHAINWPHWLKCHVLKFDCLEIPDAELQYWREVGSHVCRARVVLGQCVKVSEDPMEVFSKLMLLFSLTNSWMSAEEGSGFSQIM